MPNWLTDLLINSLTGRPTNKPSKYLTNYLGKELTNHLSQFPKLMVRGKMFKSSASLLTLNVIYLCKNVDVIRIGKYLYYFHFKTHGGESVDFISLSFH
jgi:hypothetical protein